MESSPGGPNVYGDQVNLERRLSGLEDRLGYAFKDRVLLVQALTHGSFGDGRRKIDNYQRLEFLGDRVLGLFTAGILYLKSDEDEGGLARKLNALVRKETCAEVAVELELGSLIHMSKATEKQGGRDRVSILGDASEAILGAIYLDGGYDAAKAFYNRFWHDRMLGVLGRSLKDPKTELQERAAAKKMSAPDYKVVEQTGPDHRPSFVISVAIGDDWVGTGSGANKKDAEREAAQDLLDKWGAQ